MKVLYIGYYRDGTGWANAAQGYILSLDAAGVDVVPRFVKLNDRDASIPTRIKQLEGRSHKNCDIVIQHLLPHHMEFNGEFEKNIALYVTETDHCKNTFWPERINLMDEAWVPNSYMAERSSINSYIETKHKVVPHAACMEKYQKEYEPLKIPETEGKFVFYYIGEINKRKNISDLLKAFHTEFEKSEDVSIVLKAHSSQGGRSYSERQLRELSSAVKIGLKLYPRESDYNEEVFICDYLSEEDIMRLHSSFDCFVSATYGEAWGIPIFDAMAMGKTPICTNCSGPKDYLVDSGYLVNSNKTPCFGMTETFGDMYVGNENWDSIDINCLRQSMRTAFENNKDRESRSTHGMNNAYNYSYDAVGSIMKKILEEKNA